MKDKFILFCLLISCVSKQNLSEKDIKVIEFSSYTIVYQGKNSMDLRNKIQVAFYKDNILYKVPYVVLDKAPADTSFRTVINLADTNGVEYYKYYLVKKGDSKGLVYDSLSKKKTFKYAPFLQGEGLSFEEYGLFTLELGQPDKVDRNKNTQNVEIEKFYNKIRGKVEPDSLYRYYSKDLLDVDFSLNPSLDKGAKSKLWKIGLIYNSGPNTNGDPTLPRREAFWKFEKVRVSDLKTFQDYFENFIVEREKFDLK